MAILAGREEEVVAILAGREEGEEEAVELRLKLRSLGKSNVLIF